MKISKLFHWLYGVIMLLPIFAIGSTILVNTFNKEVKQPTQEAEITYKYQTNEVNTINDIVSGNIYHLGYDSSTPNGYVLSDYLYNDEDGYYISGILVDLTQFYIQSSGSYLDEKYFESTLTEFQCFINLSQYELSIRIPGENSYFTYVLELDDVDTCVFNFDIVIDEVYVGSQEYINDLVSICENIPIENVEIIETETSDNDIFYYAVDKVQQSPLFNWAYNSFLVTPFAYIVSLFSMPTNSFVVMLLSYWLAISIIWLVFDLVMYVPLLIHRWIDKGVLE